MIKESCKIYELLIDKNCTSALRVPRAVTRLTVYRPFLHNHVILVVPRGAWSEFFFDLWHLQTFIAQKFDVRFGPNLVRV